MTVPQAARYIGVSRQYVHTIIDRFETLSRLGNDSGPLIISRVELDTWKTTREEK